MKRITLASDVGSETGGCNASGGAKRGMPTSALLLMALLFAGRRRISSSLAVLLVCVMAPSVALAHAPGTGTEIDHTHLDTPHAALFVPESEAKLLSSAEKIFELPAEETLLSPVISPDGSALLFSTINRRALFHTELPGGEPRLLLAQKGAGWMPAFRDGGARVLVRPQGRPHEGLPFIELDTKGAFLGPRPEAPGLSVRAEQEHIFLHATGEDVQISSDEEDDRFYGPVLAPDGRHVLFFGVRTGLFLYRVRDGHLFWLGHGSAPSFAPSGDALVFERTADEGLVLTGSDLFFVDLTSSPAIEQLTDTPDVIEREPSLTQDHQVVYRIDNVVYRAKRSR